MILIGSKRGMVQSSSFPIPLQTKQPHELGLSWSLFYKLYIWTVFGLESEAKDWTFLVEWPL